MNWHARYTQQANWTRDLRNYIFDQVGLETAERVLEVGCGTGAILSQIETYSLHGLDIQPASLMEAHIHAPAASLTCGDALSLPYPNDVFNITFCHFLLLWVPDAKQALQEMIRVTKDGGHILALAEPDYTSRVDEPAELAVLGRWQAEALQRQGVDPSLGGKLANLFYQTKIELIETGVIESQGNDALTPDERELEWIVLENDLAGVVPVEEIHRLKKLDEAAWARGERILHVPTYFAWGQV
jgi:ubiquinone/menaquinone biosynthesis C-methylase UbiE